MSPNDLKEGKDQKQYTFKYALTVVAGLVGFVTILIIVGSLLAGLWLDKQFDTSPLFLVLFLCASAPVTIIIMLWIVRSVTSRLHSTTQGETEILEEANSGTDTR